MVQRFDASFALAHRSHDGFLGGHRFGTLRANSFIEMPGRSLCRSFLGSGSSAGSGASVFGSRSWRRSLTRRSTTILIRASVVFIGNSSQTQQIRAGQGGKPGFQRRKPVGRRFGRQFGRWLMRDRLWHVFDRLR